MKKYRSSIFGRSPRSPRPKREASKRSPSKQTSSKRHSHSEARGVRQGARRDVRKKRGFASILSLLVIFAGLGLLGYSMLGASGAIAGVMRASFGSADAPQTTDMTLTVPKMARVEDSPVYTAAASDTAALDQGAVHVEGTGFPWDAEANVYIAGHRLGYPGTGSFLQFQDLNKLQNGDEIILTDANGTTYTYTVFEEITVAPNDYQVTAPIPGKNIVSLQTCTLPDYSHRLIVRGELTSIT